MNSWWQAGQLAAQHAQAQQAQQAWYPKQGQKQAKRGGKHFHRGCRGSGQSHRAESPGAGSKCKPPTASSQNSLCPTQRQSQLAIIELSSL